MTTYSPKNAATVALGDRLRPLVTIGPAVPLGGAADDHPWTVARIQPLDGAGTIRIWANPDGTRTSRVSPANYGTFAPDAQIEVADS